MFSGEPDNQLSIVADNQIITVLWRNLESNVIWNGIINPCKWNAFRKLFRWIWFSFICRAFSLIIINFYESFEWFAPCKVHTINAFQNINVKIGRVENEQVGYKTIFHRFFFHPQMYDAVLSFYCFIESPNLLEYKWKHIVPHQQS